MRARIHRSFCILCLLAAVYGNAAAELEMKVDAPKNMTTGDMVLVKVHITETDDSANNRIGGVELYKTEKQTSAPSYLPRYKLFEVGNPDPTAREFNAVFIVTSPESGKQHFAVRATPSDRWEIFSIDVAEKVVLVGEKGKISLSQGVYTGIVDSMNSTYGFRVYTCPMTPKFGEIGDTKVRWMTNFSELSANYGVEIGSAYNKDVRTAPVFTVEYTLGPEKDTGIVYYLIHSGYYHARGRWDLIGVRYAGSSL